MNGEPAFGWDAIEVRGARENNLRDISIDIPKRKLTVFTGVSGSGKSSLVFGTIAAESRRLIDETYTAFLQNFMPTRARPDVDSLQNLSAAIIVDPRSSSSFRRRGRPVRSLPDFNPTSPSRLVTDDLHEGARSSTAACRGRIHR